MLRPQAYSNSYNTARVSPHYNAIFILHQGSGYQDSHRHSALFSSASCTLDFPNNNKRTGFSFSVIRLAVNVYNVLGDSTLDIY